MFQKVWLVLIGLGSALTFAACSSSSGSGGSGGSSSSTDNTGAAVAAIFSSDSGAALKALMVKHQTGDDGEDLGGEAGERNTCDDPDGNGEADGPQEVSAPLTGEAGTYGDEVGGQSVTVTADDFCQDADETENTGTGPGGLGLVASFSLISTVTGTCTGSDGSSETVSMTSGSGVWRNTDDSFPEVYGTFVVDGTTVDCTIFLNEDQTVRDGSSCSSGGSAISLDSDATCQLNATEDEDTEDTGEGGEDIGEDEEDM